MTVLRIWVKCCNERKHKNCNEPFDNHTTPARPTLTVSKSPELICLTDNYQVASKPILEDIVFNTSETLQYCNT